MDNKEFEFAWQNRKRSNKALIALCCVLGTVVIAMGAWIAVLMLDGGEEFYPGDPIRGLSIQAVKEEGDRVLVETNYGTVEYPFAFSDVIQAEALNLGSATALELSADLGDGIYPMMRIWFNRDEGIPLGTLMLDGQEVTVSAQLYGAPKGLSQDRRNTFLAAQECFNDIVNSMMNIPGFTPAQ